MRYVRWVRAQLYLRQKWRAFADAVVVALGINVWVSLILVPGLFTGAFSSGLVVALCAVPLGVLMIGLARRSEGLLLLGFPIALLLPALAQPALFDEEVFSALRFALVAAGLVAYMFGASVFTFFYEPEPPVRSRALSSASQPTPERWRRRFRVYRALAAISAVYPAVLVAELLFSSSNHEFMREVYPGRAEAMAAVFCLLIFAVWGLLYALFFFGALKHHRTGDRDLLADLALLRRRGRRGRPGPRFYIGVVLALGLMLLLLAIR